MLSNNKLKTVSFNDLKKQKTINIKSDPIIGCLLSDLSKTSDTDTIKDHHYSLDLNDIDKILKLISTLDLYISNPSHAPSMPEDVKPYFDAIKSLYLKSNMSVDFSLMSSITTVDNDILNLF